MRHGVSRYRTAIEWLLSAAAVGTIVLVMFSADTPVRDYGHAAASHLAGDATVPRMPKPVVDAGRTAWRICMDHQPLAGFAGVAIVLVMFMRRMR